MNLLKNSALERDKVSTLNKLAKQLRDFEKIFIKHNIKDIDHDNYGKHLKKAVTEFSSLHL